MAKWVRLENNIVVEALDSSPSGRYHASLVWLPCGYEVGYGWVYSQGAFSPPVSVKADEQEKVKSYILAFEEKKNSRKIEHPQIPGSFFMPSSKIDRIISRCDELAKSDPLPTNNGCFDDIDETPVPMTVGQLKKLRNAIIDREDANEANRKAHISAMKEYENPREYNYSGGWK